MAVKNKVSSKELSKEIAKLKLSYNPYELAHKIIDFGLVLTGIKLYNYQRRAVFRIIYSIISFEGAIITMLWARQSGKSESVAFVIVTLSTILPTLAKLYPKELGQFAREGVRIGLFAPQYDQITTTYDRVLARVSSDAALGVMADPEINTANIYLSRFHLNNGSSLTGQVASKRSKIESKTYDLIFIEEAQDVDDFLIEKSIEPMVTATGGTIVKVGTTGTSKSDFFSEIRRNALKNARIADEWLYLHFEFTYKDIIREKEAQYKIDGDLFHLHYGKIVKDLISRRGIDSLSFQLSYALKWQLDTGMFLDSKDWESMTKRKLGFTAPEDVEDYWFIRAGLDIAKDVASTILTIGGVCYDSESGGIVAKRIFRFIELHKVSYEEQHQVIMDALIDYEVEILVADYTGVGRPVVDRLMAEADWLTIVPYTFTRQSKSDMWVVLTSDIQMQCLEIPANKASRETSEFQNCHKQMTELTKSWEGGCLIAAKPAGGFDDYADSLGMFAVACNNDSEVTGAMEIEITDNDLYDCSRYEAIKSGGLK